MLLEAFVEILLLSTLVFGSYFGYRKGIFRLAVAPFRAVICLAFAWYFSRWVGDVLISPFVFPAVRNQLFELLSEKLQFDNSINSLPTVLKIPLGLSIFGGEDLDEWSLDQFVDMLADPLTTLVSRIIAFSLLFIISTIVLRLFIRLIDAFLDKGILGRINVILGAILSGIISLLSACCLASALDYLLSLAPFSAGDFVGGPLFRLLREVSLLRLLLSF